MRAILVSLLLVACGDPTMLPAEDTDSGVGGATVASGGAMALGTGGTPETATGGATAEQIGGQATGGAVSTGGSPATGGAATGGAGTGGKVATGGSSTGGVVLSTTGGAATGGAWATGGSATGGVSAGGALPIGIAGAAGYSCPAALWDVAIIGDKIRTIGYNTEGMCVGVSESKCSGTYCTAIRVYQKNSAAISLLANSRYTAISRDFSAHSCVSVGSTAGQSAPTLGLKLDYMSRFWLVEEHCDSTLSTCDRSCDSASAP